MKKNLIKKVNNELYQRIPIKTKVLTENDDMAAIVSEYTKDKIKKNDIITISESPLAITQGRAIPEDKIKPGFLANLLWRFVANVKYGTGLRSPLSMQCAIDECGSVRILIAAVAAAFTKLIGRKGDFYRIAGMQAGLIDAAHTSPVEPYDKCVLKGPKNPDKVARKIQNQLTFKNQVTVMDINDIGGSWVIGKTDGINTELIEKIMDDNPQGQEKQLTPICLIRKLS